MKSKKKVDISSLPKYSTGGIMASAGTGLVTGAAAGSIIPGWGTAVGGIIGLGTGLYQGIAEDKSERTALAEQNKVRDLSYDAIANSMNQRNNNFLNQFALGGAINQYSGQTHAGADGGIPIDKSGVPTSKSGRQAVGLTEAGEISWGQYIFSDRLKPKKDKETFADKAKAVTNKYKRRLGEKLDGTDKLAREAMNKELDILAREQEERRPKKRAQEGLPQFALGGLTGMEPKRFSKFDLDRHYSNIIRQRGGASKQDYLNALGMDIDPNDPFFKEALAQNNNGLGTPINNEATISAQGQERPGMLDINQIDVNNTYPSASSRSTTDGQSVVGNNPGLQPDVKSGSSNLNNALSFLPAAINVGRGLFGKATEYDYADYKLDDPEESRKIDISQQLRDIEGLGATRRQASRGRMSQMIASDVAEDQMKARAYEYQDNANIQLEAQDRRMQMMTDRTNVDTKLNLSQLNEANKAAKDNLISAGLSQAISAGQGIKQDKMMKEYIDSLTTYYPDEKAVIGDAEVKEVAAGDLTVESGGKGDVQELDYNSFKADPAGWYTKLANEEGDKLRVIDPKTGQGRYVTKDELKGIYEGHLKEGITAGATGKPVDILMNAIGLQESNNDYGAVGQLIADGEHAGTKAYGKYQIMPSNIKAWSKEILGVEKESLTDVEQEVIAKAKFNQYYDDVSKYTDNEEDRIKLTAVRWYGNMGGPMPKSVDEISEEYKTIDGVKQPSPLEYANSVLDKYKTAKKGYTASLDVPYNETGAYKQGIESFDKFADQLDFLGSEYQAADEDEPYDWGDAAYTAGGIGAALGLGYGSVKGAKAIKKGVGALRNNKSSVAEPAVVEGGASIKNSGDATVGLVKKGHNVDLKNQRYKPVGTDQWTKIPNEKTDPFGYNEYLEKTGQDKLNLKNVNVKPKAYPYATKGKTGNLEMQFASKADYQKMLKTKVGKVSFEDFWKAWDNNNGQMTFEQYDKLMAKSGLKKPAVLKQKITSMIKKGNLPKNFSANLEKYMAEELGYNLREIGHISDKRMADIKGSGYKTKLNIDRADLKAMNPTEAARAVKNYNELRASGGVGADGVKLKGMGVPTSVKAALKQQVANLKSKLKSAGRGTMKMIGGAAILVPLAFEMKDGIDMVNEYVKAYPEMKDLSWGEKLKLIRAIEDNDPDIQRMRSAERSRKAGMSPKTSYYDQNPI